MISLKPQNAGKLSCPASEKQCYALGKESADLWRIAEAREHKKPPPYQHSKPGN